MAERIDTPFTNEHFAAWCLKMVGQPYWYGTCGYKCSSSLLKKKRNQYPNNYASKYESQYQQNIKDRKVCADCIGGCKGYAWTGGGQSILDAIGTGKSISSSYGSHGCPDKGANGMFTYAKSKGCSWGPIDTLPEIPGLALYKDGHAGYYVGDGWAVEWKGTAYGCVKTAVKGRGWTNWYMLPFIDYGNAQIDTVANTDLPLGSRQLKNGSDGTDVKTMQDLLLQLGYDLGRCGVDGKFGFATEKAVKAFQKKAGIKQDGIYGPDTHTALMNAVSEKDSGTSAEPEEAQPESAQKTVIISATSGNVNIRYGNSTNYACITSVPSAIHLPFVAIAENGWYAVAVNGMVGWIQSGCAEIE